MTRRGTRGRWFAALGIVLLMIAGTFAPALSGSKRVQPTSHAGRVKVQIGAKSSSYHRATKAKPAVFQVTGPTKLKLVFRSLPPAAGTRAQSVRISVDGEETKALELKAAASTKARLADQRAVGNLRTRTLDIPAGMHKVRVAPLASGDAVGVRAFRRTVARTSIKWVTFAPERFERSLRVRSGDRETTCYRFTPSSPLGLTLHGPTRLKVATRVEFDHFTGATLAYVVRAYLDGQPLESHSMTSRVSHTVTYPEMPAIVPGLAREFTLSIPSGTHDVELRLEGTTAPAATATLRVPESSVKTKAKTKASRPRAIRGTVRGS